ncbi:MAG: hypothetical protein C0174_04605 [Thermodesulfobium narugense]|nr:MAG: hypothetical protein C0174_04605 [Thermodesulfobium narugense]
MGKRIKYGFILFLVSVIAFSAGFTLKSNMASGSTNWGMLQYVYNLVENYYVAPSTLDPTKLVQGAIRGMVQAVGDPYTRYVDPESFAQMKDQLEGSFSGIGIEMGVKDKSIVVIAPIEGTPAYKAGIKANDRIVSVDEKPIDGMDINQVVKLIRGPVGTQVKIGIERKGELKEFNITRETIEINSVTFRPITYQIGYLRISTFNDKTYDEFKSYLPEIEKMKALILDLRNDPGGTVTTCLDIAGYFVGDNPVVITVNRNGNQTKVYSPYKDSKLDIPVVVLVNEGSASAAEILSGAMKDYGYTLIGEKTFGKGLIQSVIPLYDNSALVITTEKYLTPLGYDINKIGIEPNIIVPDPKDWQDMGKNPEKDPQLNEAIKILRAKDGIY